jgi:hypothetical protein
MAMPQVDAGIPFIPPVHSENTSSRREPRALDSAFCPPIKLPKVMCAIHLDLLSILRNLGKRGRQGLVHGHGHGAKIAIQRMPVRGGIQDRYYQILSLQRK